MSSRWSIGLKITKYACMGLGLGFMTLAHAATSNASVTTSTTVTTKQGAVSKTVTTVVKSQVTSESASAKAKAQAKAESVKAEPATAQATKVEAAGASVSGAVSLGLGSTGVGSTGAGKAVETGQYANLPLSVYLNALSEKLEYDEAFNYVKRGKIAYLSTGYNAYRVPRHMVDKVVVYKSHYLMELLKDGKVVRKYWIALSDRPQGDKQFEGDRKTPEGTYTLDYIKERSYFYRAFHISYPNPQDIAEARSLGRRPGGMIMVHGQPPSDSEYEESVQRSNWTNGCIAILNHEIDEFIELVDPGTPIEIRP